MRVVDDSPPSARPLSFRPTAPEARALDLMAGRLGVPRSAVIRAGIRAVWADPSLVWSAPPVGGELRPQAPPPPPSKRGRKRR